MELMELFALELWQWEYNGMNRVLALTSLLGSVIWHIFKFYWQKPGPPLQRREPCGGWEQEKEPWCEPLSLEGAPVCALGKRSEKTIHWACNAFDRRHFKQAAGGTAASGPMATVPTALRTNGHSARHAVCWKRQGHEDCMWGATHCGTGG